MLHDMNLHAHGWVGVGLSVGTRWARARVCWL